MQAPIVTIVTPSYNQGRFVRATIESVLSQDYPHLQYIIMDGGSTDGTAGIVAEYASRLTWISEPDRGQSHAINKGFRLAKGEIVSWANSDDVILPGAVSRAVRTFERNPRAGAVYGEGYLMDLEGKITRRFPATERFNLWKLVYLSDYILSQTLYFRKSVIEEVGYLDETLHYGMDWDILIRIGKRYGLEYIPEYMGCLREYPEAKSFAGGAERIRELARMLRQHTGLRYPPGYISYGLQAYQQIWMQKIDQGAPRLLRAPATLLSLLVYVVTSYMIARTLRESQGWYPDGWASPCVFWMLPPGSGEIVIRGGLPAAEQRLAGQSLKIYCDGSLAEERPIGFGDFEFRVPASTGDGRPLEIELRASRYISHFVGRDLSVRRRAFILKGVEWSC